MSMVFKIHPRIVLVVVQQASPRSRFLTEMGLRQVAGSWLSRALRTLPMLSKRIRNT
jgi:hypothetical protein